MSIRAVLSVMVFGACQGSIVSAPRAPTDEQLTTPAPDAFHTTLGLRRLSKVEYTNTIRDQLQVDASALALPEASAVFGLTNDQHVQQVSRGDLDTYLAAADAISAQALPSLTLPAGCTAATFTDDCFDRWAPDYLTLTFRRPATDVEVARQKALFDSVQADEGPQEALRAVVQAVLVSPSFLYRFELPDATGGLDGYAVASRLSYLTWSSAPDRALLAQAGDLNDSTVLAATLETLLRDPRAEGGAVHFVSEWLGTTTQVVRKGADVTAGLDLGTLQADLEAEQRATVREALLAQGGSLQTLLTARWGFVSPSGAKILGLPAVTSLTRVDFSGLPRRGLLTSPLLIAAHAKESGFSAVQLGRFVRERLACQILQPPPPGTDTTLPPDTGGVTLSYREKLTQKTAALPCSGCHQLINPPGFAYLGYDPIGRFHQNDSQGVAFDTSGTFTNLKAPFDFADAPSMIDQLATTREVEACFARRAIEHTFGRTIDPGDVELYRDLVGALAQGDGSYRAFLATLVRSPRFTAAGPGAP